MTQTRVPEHKKIQSPSQTQSTRLFPASSVLASVQLVHWYIIAMNNRNSPADITLDGEHGKDHTR